MSCLDRDTAAAYLAGELDQADADRCAVHVAQCAACGDMLREVSALIDEVRHDLLVLDGAVEEKQPPEIETIFERARPADSPLPFTAFRTDAPDDEPHITAVAEAPAIEKRRPTRTALFVAAAAIATLFLLPSGTWAWVGEKVRAAFGQVLGGETGGTRSDASVRPSRAGTDVVLPPVNRVAAKPAKTIAAKPPVRLTLAELVLLEMDVLARLDAVGALLDGQVTVSRTESRVEVRGLLEDAARRNAVVKALGPVSRRALSVNVRTVSEELLRMTQPSTPSIRYHPLEYDAAGIPAAADVRAHLSRAGRTKDLDDEVRRIATSALRYSRAGLLHALAMESLSERYEAQALRDLNRDAYEKWTGLIASHAAAFATETRRLRELLEPVFVRDAPELETAAAESTDRVNSLVPRLRRLAVSIDDVVREGLTASTERVERVQVREREFWISVRQAERLAEQLSGKRP